MKVLLYYTWHTKVCQINVLISFIEDIMETKFKVRTRIYYNGELVSDICREKDELGTREKHQLIQIMYEEKRSRGIHLMDCYAEIETELEQLYGIKLSERMIMLVCSRLKCKPDFNLN